VSDSPAHLFVVKSAITELLALAVVEHERIHANDALFLVARGYTPSFIRDNKVALPFGPGTDKNFGRGSPSQGRERLRNFDNLIEELTGARDYHCYLTNALQRYNRILSSSPRCKAFSYVEHGIGNYRGFWKTIYDARVRIPLRGFVTYGPRVGIGAAYWPGYQHVYASGPGAFPGFPRRVEVPQVFERARQRFDTPVEHVLVFDGLTAHGRLSLDAMCRGVERMLSLLVERGVARLHYKFHPAQVHTGEDLQLEKWLAELQSPLELQRLPDDQLLESIAVSGEGAHTEFYVGTSSIAIYAAHAGCPVESYAPWIAEAEPAYQKIINKQPQLFRDAVVFLA